MRNKKKIMDLTFYGSAECKEIQKKEYGYYTCVLYSSEGCVFELLNENDDLKELKKEIDWDLYSEEDDIILTREEAKKFFKC